MSAPASVLAWLKMCSQSKELIAEFDRLRGTNLSHKGTPMTILIDEATGRFAEDAKSFFDFCMDLYQRQTLPTLIAEFDADLATLSEQELVTALEAAGCVFQEGDEPPSRLAHVSIFI